MTNLKLAAALAIAISLTWPAASSTVEVAPFGKQDGKTVYALAIAGDIKPGDDRRVASLLGEATAEDRFPGFMLISSNGGDTNAALGIAQVVHNYAMAVLVRTDCLSGCAIIALSAPRGRLFVVESGAIGLHQSWFGTDYEHAVPSLEGTRRVARALRSYGVPGWVVERMTRTPPHGLWFLSDAELRRIGALAKR